MLKPHMITAMRPRRRPKLPFKHIRKIKRIGKIESLNEKLRPEGPANAPPLLVVTSGIVARRRCGRRIVLVLVLWLRAPLAFALRYPLGFRRRAARTLVASPRHPSRRLRPFERATDLALGGLKKSPLHLIAVAKEPGGQDVRSLDLVTQELDVAGVLREGEVGRRDRGRWELDPRRTRNGRRRRRSKRSAPCTHGTNRRRQRRLGWCRAIKPRLTMLLGVGEPLGVGSQGLEVAGGLLDTNLATTMIP